MAAMNVVNSHVHRSSRSRGGLLESALMSMPDASRGEGLPERRVPKARLLMFVVVSAAVFVPPLLGRPYPLSWRPYVNGFGGAAFMLCGFWQFSPAARWWARPLWVAFCLALGLAMSEVSSLLTLAFLLASFVMLVWIAAGPRRRPPFQNRRAL